MIAQRGEDTRAVEKPKAKPVKIAAEATEKAKKSGLSFTEKHRLESLPAEIERLEAEIAKLSDLLSDPQIYTTQAVKAHKATEALAERQDKLEAAEMEWLELEEKAG